ncbi:MAG: hypothetical protein DRP01_02075 [Archaeoglobales archaeon]|nr:MAG: hypothetical protein DRP01_02075 [Archaeoglobales archaeon]
MAYFRFPVPARGFPKEKLREMKILMKMWPRFYASFHDEQRDIVPLNKLPGPRGKTRYWIEISDEPIRQDTRSWGDEIKQQEEARMAKHLQRFRDPK